MDICHSGSVHSEWAQHFVCVVVFSKIFTSYLEKVNIVILHFLGVICSV